MPRFIQQPINGHVSGIKDYKKLLKKNIMAHPVVVALLVILFVFIVAAIWYNTQLAPVGGDVAQLKQIVIKPGDNSLEIGRELEKKFIIRNATAFDIYTRLSSKNSILQAGAYRLSPTESVQQIVEHFVKGNVDQFSITFYPGATLADAKKVLQKAGYPSDEIDAAFKRNYVSPLFADKPVGASLEGYIYGETYKFNTGVTVADILQQVFDEFYSKISENNFVDGFASHGLNLYQGIILASIVQREVNGDADQQQVAQVFYSRMSQGIVLGSDVTYQYIADKMGIPRDPSLDSPYNTRRFAGLPPGPIASPGLSALRAVDNPAPGSYMYFLSGDDGKTYFGYTAEDHQYNVNNYCQIKCSTT